VESLVVHIAVVYVVVGMFLTHIAIDVGRLLSTETVPYPFGPLILGEVPKKAIRCRPHLNSSWRRRRLRGFEWYTRRKPNSALYKIGF